MKSFTITIRKILKRLQSRTRRYDNNNQFDYVSSASKNVLRFFEENVPKDNSILDVGAGRGALVCLLLQHGYADVSGVEVRFPLVIESKLLSALSLKRVKIYWS